MGLPAKRRTKQSKRERAAHIKLTSRTLAACPHCKVKILPHRVCRSCGFYKGKDVLNMTAKADRKKKRAKKREERSKS